MCKKPLDLRELLDIAAHGNPSTALMQELVLLAFDAGKIKQASMMIIEEKENSCPNCGCEMPEWCEGLFVKDGNSCQLNDKPKSALVFVGNGA